MTPPARVAAAIEVLAEIETRRRPAPDALKDWGLARRFAGSKDRAAIAGLVYDALRRKASAEWLLGEATPRARMLGALLLARGLSVEAIAALASGEGHAPAALSGAEHARLAAGEAGLAEAPVPVAGDFPEWLWPSLARAFGEGLLAEARALACRAATDIRVNTTKTTREKLAAALGHLGPAPTPHSPLGLRFEPDAEGRGPSLQVTTEFVKGHFEIQDEGSQLAALASEAAPGEQVIDLCAGAGGKTLALAAMMASKGQIFATDSDARRLAPIHERLERAGARNVQVRAPKGRGHDPLEDLVGKADLVLIDAPCTGIGTWRRNPDAKWRVRPGALAERVKEQDAVLARAAALARPGGRLVYVTCSVLPEENEDRVAAFRASPAGHGFGEPKIRRWTPASHGTDAFFVAVMRKGS